MTFSIVRAASLAAAALVALGSSARATPQALTAASPTPTSTSGEWKTSVEISAQPLTPAFAPADEYFGRQKLSNLGVRNIIHAFAVEGGSPLALPFQRARIEEVDSALVDWGDKYPRDPWLPGSVFHFADFLSGKDDPFTDAMAADLLLQASYRYRNTANEKRAVTRLRALHQATLVDYTIDTFDPPTWIDLLLMRPQ